MWTFQCSLRTYPAPLGYLLLGIGPALAGNVGAGWAFALNARGDQGVDVPMLAADLSRSARLTWSRLVFPLAVVATVRFNG